MRRKRDFTQNTKPGCCKTLQMMTGGIGNWFGDYWLNVKAFLASVNLDDHMSNVIKYYKERCV